MLNPNLTDQTRQFSCRELYSASLPSDHPNCGTCLSSSSPSPSHTQLPSVLMSFPAVQYWPRLLLVSRLTNSTNRSYLPASSSLSRAAPRASHSFLASIQPTRLSERNRQAGPTGSNSGGHSRAAAETQREEMSKYWIFCDFLPTKNMKNVCFYCQFY